MASRVFVDAHYAQECRLEVQEEDGSWRPATLYRHRRHHNTVVVSFGDGEYEGLCGTYRFNRSPPLKHQLQDGDGDIIPTRGMRSSPEKVPEKAKKKRKKREKKGMADLSAGKKHKHAAASDGQPQPAPAHNARDLAEAHGGAAAEEDAVQEMFLGSARVHCVGIQYYRGVVSNKEVSRPPIAPLARSGPPRLPHPLAPSLARSLPPSPLLVSSLRPSLRRSLRRSPSLPSSPHPSRPPLSLFLRATPACQSVTLRREPRNRYDSNAIQALNINSIQVATRTHACLAHHTHHHHHCPRARTHTPTRAHTHPPNATPHRLARRWGM